MYQEGCSSPKRIRRYTSSTFPLDSHKRQSKPCCTCYKRRKIIWRFMNLDANIAKASTPAIHGTMYMRMPHLVNWGSGEQSSKSSSMDLFRDFIICSLENWTKHMHMPAKPSELRSGWAVSPRPLFSIFIHLRLLAPPEFQFVFGPCHLERDALHCKTLFTPRPQDIFKMREWSDVWMVPKVSKDCSKRR